MAQWNTLKHPIILNREEELRLATTRLDNLINQIPLPDPILFFYGVPMVGKSTLLHEIQRKATERKMPVVFIDFDREQSSMDGDLINGRYDGEYGCVLLAKDVMEKLIWSADAPTGESIKVTDSSYIAARKLVEYITWLQGFHKPLVLLFDTLEDAPVDTFAWWQEAVLTPLLEGGRLFIAIAGWSDYQESRHQFKWPVLRRMYSHHLRPFDPEQSEKQLRNLDDQNRWLENNLIELTGGLPGLNEELVIVPMEDEGELLRHMVEKVIFHRLFKKEPISDIKEELRILSAFRQFDTRLLQHTMKALWPEKYSDLTPFTVRQHLLKQLRAASVVEQHPDGFGYVVPHDIRRILDAEQQRNKQEQHFKVHCLATQWFHQQVEKGDVVMVADELYHLAGAWRDAAALHKAMPGELPDGQNREFQLQKQLLAGLAQLKNNDRSYELVEKIIYVLRGEEFRWLLSENELSNLIEWCQRFMDEL